MIWCEQGVVGVEVKLAVIEHEMWLVLVECEMWLMVMEMDVGAAARGVVVDVVAPEAVAA